MLQELISRCPKIPESFLRFVEVKEADDGGAFLIASAAWLKTLLSIFMAAAELEKGDMGERQECGGSQRPDLAPTPSVASSGISSSSAFRSLIPLMLVQIARFLLPCPWSPSSQLEQAHAAFKQLVMLSGIHTDAGLIDASLPRVCVPVYVHECVNLCGNFHTTLCEL